MAADPKISAEIEKIAKEIKVKIDKLKAVSDKGKKAADAALALITKNKKADE